MPTARLADLDVRYELLGDSKGHPLAFIMGLAGSLDVWEPQMLRMLAPHFRILLFDNRDAGGTKWLTPPHDYTIKEMAADALRLMDHVGFERAHVVGVSMGGMIAQELTLGYPDRVDRLVLGCTTPGMESGVPPSAEVMAIMAADGKGISRLRVGLNMARVAMTPGWALTHFYRLPGLLLRAGRYPIEPAAYARQMVAIGAFEAGKRLSDLKKPTLVIHGEADILLPPENGRRLAEFVPGARLVIYPRAAHGFFTEQPRRLARTLSGFFLEDRAV